MNCDLFHFHGKLLSLSQFSTLSTPDLMVCLQRNVASEVSCFSYLNDSHNWPAGIVEFFQLICWHLVSSNGSSISSNLPSFRLYEIVHVCVDVQFQSRSFSFIPSRLFPSFLPSPAFPWLVRKSETLTKERKKSFLLLSIQTLGLLFTLLLFLSLSCSLSFFSLSSLFFLSRILFRLNLPLLTSHVYTLPFPRCCIPLIDSAADSFIHPFFSLFNSHIAYRINTTTHGTETPTGAVCYFPIEYQGSFLIQEQSQPNPEKGGITVSYSEITIEADSIPPWGRCYQRRGNIVILKDSTGPQDCMRCLHLTLKTPNVIQIHTEGK